MIQLIPKFAKVECMDELCLVQSTFSFVFFFFFVMYQITWG